MVAARELYVVLRFSAPGKRERPPAGRGFVLYCAQPRRMIILRGRSFGSGFSGGPGIRLSRPLGTC